MGAVKLQNQFAYRARFICMVTNEADIIRIVFINFQYRCYIININHTDTKELQHQWLFQSLWSRYIIDWLINI